MANTPLVRVALQKVTNATDTHTLDQPVIRLDGPGQTVRVFQCRVLLFVVLLLVVPIPLAGNHLSEHGDQGSADDGC